MHPLRSLPLPITLPVPLPLPLRLPVASANTPTSASASANTHAAAPVSNVNPNHGALEAGRAWLTRTGGKGNHDRVRDRKAYGIGFWDRITVTLSVTLTLTLTRTPALTLATPLALTLTCTDSSALTTAPARPLIQGWGPPVPHGAWNPHLPPQRGYPEPTPVPNPDSVLG